MGQFLLNFLQAVINSLATVFTWVINLLPTSPFTVGNFTFPTNYLSYFNWLFPVGNILTIMTAWLGAIILYYVVMSILRFIKLI